MSDRPEPLNPFFRLTIVVGGVFVATIFAFVATIFGDPRAPVAQFFDEYGGRLITIEVVAILVTVIMAMKFDRTKVLRNEWHRGERGTPPQEAVSPSTEREAFDGRKGYDDQEPLS